MEVQASSAMALTHHALRELRLPGHVCRTYGLRPRPQQRLMSQIWILVFRPTSLHNLIWYYERGSDAFVREWKDITISWYVQFGRFRSYDESSSTDFFPLFFQVEVKKELKVCKSKMETQTKQVTEYSQRLEDYDKKFEESSRKFQTLLTVSWILSPCIL